MRVQRGLWGLAAALFVAAGARAEDFRREDLYAFTAPEGWFRAGAPPAGQREDARIRKFDLTGIDVLYYDPKSGAVLENLNVVTDAGSLRLADEQAVEELLRETAARTGRALGTMVDVDATGRRTVGTTEFAYLESRWSHGGQTVRQYQAFVPGRRHTYILTFTFAGDDYDKRAELRERVLASLRLLDGGPPRIWANPLVWTCLGVPLLAGAGAGMWWWRKRRSRDR